ncbi:DoxX family protein [Amycolatopsis jiangsuensis]|uniref:Putative oxidoreductase n=1 Tax=Amycolatopsis jiangsuensis TaxID=1181879 RepID=A0A840J501_9PSEU|nr:DoxX family protein [Amycolatopsis jiangsuensis]MBB4688903.1 putative oxidoreductase [Amycolatopsis jiangsuensis]
MRTSTAAPTAPAAAVTSTVAPTAPAVTSTAAAPDSAGLVPDPGTSTAATRPLPDRARPVVLGLFRIVVSVLFLCHGAQGFGLLGGVDGHGMAVPFGQWPGWWASAIEVAGALLVLAGLYTRAAAIVLSGVMAYAYFTVHAPLGLLPLQNMGEPAALYSWVFLAIAVVGPGAFALDRLRRR